LTALALTRIFLHHWHRFRHHLIEVEGSFYLAGHNGSGKSSVLDAIQLVIVADLGRLHFNRLADEHSDRTLDSYVRGKLGENRWLRDFDTVGYVALEFATPDRKTVVTAGACIEASPKEPAVRAYFLLSEPLDPNLFVPDGKSGLSRRDLKKLLKSRSKANVYDPDVESYQQDLLTRLGNLNPHSFYELFLRALHFRPEPNISRFVEQWVLGDKRIDTQNLVAVRERLADLQQDAQRVAKRLEALGEIVQQQAEVRRLIGLRNQWALVAVFLRTTQAEQELADRVAQSQKAQAELTATQTTLAEAQSARTQTEDRFQDIQRQLFGNSVRQEAERLDKRIRELENTIAQLQTRRRRLQASLRQLTDSLRLLWSTTVFDDSERRVVEEWKITLQGFNPNSAPPLELSARLAALIRVLEAARDRANETRTRLKDELEATRQQITDLQTEFEQLKTKNRRQPDRQAERLRERLQAVVGVRPVQLWEALEIAPTFEPWQEAIEVMLGGRRFNFIVPPEKFQAAARELRQARQDEKIIELGLIDLERAAQAARPARPNSLAQFVKGNTDSVKAYLDQVLGDIIACERDEELREHRRAITVDLMHYSEWVQRTLRPPDLFIGQQAVQRRLQIIERELAQLAEKQAALERQQREIVAALGLLKSRDDLVRRQPELESPLDESLLVSELAQTQAARAALDLSGLAELERQRAELEQVLKRLTEEIGRLQKRQGGLETQLKQLTAAIEEAEGRVADQQRATAEARAQYPDSVGAAEKLASERLAKSDLAAEIRIAENTRQSQQTQADKAGDEYRRRASLYNNTENFPGNFADEAEPAYAAEYQRLEATTLPQYREKIAEAEQEADRELREHVLHSLRDSIEEARQKLRSLNEALRQLPPFRNEKYRFQTEVNAEQKEFYALIMSSADLGDQPLQGSLFYQQNQAVFEKFFAVVTHPPASATDPRQKEYEQLLDYRRYLTYDILVTDTQTQQEDRLSKIIHQRSGGETQAPFYLTIAASFLQLYKIQERTQRPTLRMVVFDEAFSKMDQNFIGATLDMFHQFGLQIVTATPLERCEYIAPKVRTSLILTAVGNSVDLVKLDDYRNYHAPNSAASGA
jgi:uncharacterized protein YPO0396